MNEPKKEFQNNTHPNLIAQYLVYTKDSTTGECIYNYMGNEFNIADRAFSRQVIHLKLTPLENKNAEVIFEDAYNEKIVKSFNNKTNDMH